MEYHIPLSRVREIYRAAKEQDATWGHIDAEAWYREREIGLEKLAIAEQRIVELETEMRILGECVATLDDENAALRELSERHAPVGDSATPPGNTAQETALADRGGVIFQMEGEPTLLALTPSDATLGNPAWDNWRAEVAAWDALSDEAWAEIDANQHTQQGD